VTKPGFELTVFGADDRPTSLVAGRRIVYLDSAGWIDIAEKNARVAASCVCAVEAGTALFPVSYAAISELMEQPNASQAQAIADLMDRLSLGVTFRPNSTIQLIEADWALFALLGGPDTAPDRTAVVSWLPDYLGTLTYRFPERSDPAEAARFVNHVRNDPELKSVRWFVDHAPLGDIKRYHAESKADYVTRFSRSIAEGSGAVAHLRGADRQAKLIWEERAWFLHNKVLPRFRKTLLKTFGERAVAVIRALTLTIGEGGMARLEHQMANMPSVSLECEIMAQRVANRQRRVRPQDFADVEHAVAGAVYADAFVTKDGGLVDLLVERCKTPAARGCRIIGVEDLPALLAA
jgi:hypothetical protein